MISSFIGGEPGLLSRFRVGLCRSTDLESRHELERPLYYILEEVGSEELSQRSINSIGKVETCQEEGSQQRFQKLRYRLSWFPVCPARRRFASESISLQVDTSVSADGTESIEVPKTLPSVFDSNPIITSQQCPEGKSICGSDFFPKRVCNTCPSGIPALFPSIAQRMDEALSFWNRSSSQVGAERRDIDLSEHSSVDTAYLGASFPHPAYIEKCRLLLIGKDATRDEHNRSLWEGLETGLTDRDDLSLPPTRTEVQTTRADSWDSERSSPCPTGEQSSQDDCFDNIAVSVDEFPFDEPATHIVPTTPVIGIDVGRIASSHVSNSGEFVLPYVDDETSIDSCTWICFQDLSTPGHRYHQPFCSMVDSGSIIFRGPASIAT
jgi:hypothetical protein